ncbi:hypothetical protein C0J52_20023 [Blattella germanica]|nr:hypothetical protein C0J52_20023 [Blattella germanica]
MHSVMAGMLGYSREAIRVKVKPEYRKFSVDPQITSFEVLQSILAKAFDIRGEFTVCYRAFDDYGQETYLSLLSDWDLDAAFLRKVVWKHILNVYPDGMSGKERMDYMKKKAYEYQALRDCWKEMVQDGQVTGDLAYVTSMVRKDVLRTDRHHRFYAGSDDNQNIASLFNILTTYALNHPTVSYCQGMSDLASPLLVTMGDEAHAYICFCALMKRLHTNFLLDGIVMTLKFQHLAEALLYYDPEFYAYLKSHQREFAFDDALRMLEVLWSSLPPSPPQKELQLFEKQFTTLTEEDPPIVSPLLKTPRENAYTKVCALRRQSSSVSLHSLSISSGPRQVIRHRQNMSLDETSTLKERNKVKPFASLDDTSLHMISHNSHSTTSFEALTEPESDETTLNNHINSNTSVNSSTSNLVIQKRGYLQDLKDKFSGSQSKLFSSMEKVDQDVIKEDASEKSQVKVVKNLNEFLNFTALNKNRLLPDKIVPSASPKKESSQAWQENQCNEDSPRKEVWQENKCNEKVNSEIIDPSIAIPIKEFDSSCDEKSEKIPTDGLDTFCDGSSPDDSTEYFPMTTSMTRELRLELENLDRQVFGSKFNQHNFALEDSEELESPCSESFHSVDVKVSETTVVEVADICPEPNAKPLMLHLEQPSDSDKKLKRLTQHFSPGTGEEIFVWENPLQCPTTPDEQADLEYDETHGDTFNVSVSGGEIFENEGMGIKSVTPIRLLRSSVGIQDQNQSGNATDDASDSSDGWNDHRAEDTTVTADKQNSDAMQLQRPKGHRDSIPPTAMTNSCEEVTEHAPPISSSKPAVQCSSTQLPPPSEFGGGNPFLMFLCLTVLRQHRDKVMNNAMDYNEMAMHFDKMIRKHNVTRVLNQARQMFAAYLRQQASLNNNTNV